jgi:uncharacterized membrane protein YfcA
MTLPDPLLLAGILAVAVLYSAVGHAGASGYIAVMTLAGIAPAEIRPAALVLNILVATLTSWRFVSAGHVDWRLVAWAVGPALPAAFLGGRLGLPVAALTAALGVILLLSAANLLRTASADDAAIRRAPAPAVATAGAAIGLLSGLTGTGGGIFLTPLLIALHWAPTRVAAGCSALFILGNSIAGLAGTLSARPALPAFLPALLAVALVGAAIGSTLGSRRVSVPAIRRALAAVLVIAGLKLLAT